MVPVSLSTVQKPDLLQLWQSKPIPLPVNPPVLLGLAIPIRSNLQIMLLGFSISGRILISYCEVQNIHFDTLLSVFVV
jgi:hypothetical protein